MKLSILIPVYNEEKTIEEIINIIMKTGIDKEIIIVDDGSNDGTKKILRKFKKQYDKSIKVIYNERNIGKGAAIRTGLNYISGDVVIIQDADLEYDPAEYSKLISPIRDNYAQVVYGSRFLVKRNSFLSLQYFANYFLTTVTNLLFNTKLTDMETCYKVFKNSLFKDLGIESRGFEVEAEITAKLLKKGYKIHEVPIHYRGRSYHQGKKLVWYDAVKTLFTLLRYRFNK